MIDHIHHEKSLKSEPVEISETTFNWCALVAFIVTFLYMEFAAHITSGFGDGVLFVLVGAVVTSYAILPVFLDMQHRFPHYAIAWLIGDVVVTIVVTAVVYYFCFSQYSLMNYLI